MNSPQPRHQSVRQASHHTEEKVKISAQLAVSGRSSPLWPDSYSIVLSNCAEGSPRINGGIPLTSAFRRKWELNYNSFHLSANVMGSTFCAQIQKALGVLVLTSGSGSLFVTNLTKSLQQPQSFSSSV